MNDQTPSGQYRVQLTDARGNVKPPYEVPPFLHKYGTHLWGIEKRLILDRQFLIDTFNKALEEYGFGKWTEGSKQFEPQGASGLWGLENSHGGWDTYPELGEIRRMDEIGDADRIGMIDLFGSSCLGRNTFRPVANRFIERVNPGFVHRYTDKNVSSSRPKRSLASY